MKTTKLTHQLANRLNEVLLNGKWVSGTNIKEQILSVNWTQATTKVSTLNTIADLTFHIHYYIAGVINVLEGGTLDIKDKYSFDAPPITSQTDWKNLIDTFCNDSKKMVKLIQKMPEESLFKIFSDEKYGTYYRNIDVIIEHSYYHLGQIVLIKKLLKNKSETTSSN